jgi:hypothetical protein
MFANKSFQSRIENKNLSFKPPITTLKVAMEDLLL